MKYIHRATINEMNEIDQWRDHLRSCVRAGGGHFEYML